MSDATLPPGLRAGGRFDAWEAPPIQWLACDADGTLLGPDDLVSDVVADAMQTTAARGIPVGIVTGRMRQGAERIHRRFPVPGPHVLHNGAEVRYDGTTLADWPLAPAAVQAILAIAADLDAYGELYTSEGFTITRDHEAAEDHWRSLEQWPQGISTVDDPPTAPVLKATFVGFDDAESVRLHAAFADAGLTVGTATSMAHPERTYLNVTAPGVDKAHAITAVADHLGIELASVAMIGDGHNDLPALQIVGSAIAMGQAADDIIGAAHLVTAAVTEDGVAVALRALGLLG